MSEQSKPEIIDVEYEVLEDEPSGPVIDAEKITPPPRARVGNPTLEPGQPGAILGDFIGSVLKTPLGKAAAIGYGIYQVGKAVKKNEKARKRKGRKRKKRARKAISRIRRQI